jgi:hypothetical protein
MKAVTTLFCSLVLASAAVAADAQFVVDDPYAGLYEGTFQTRLARGKAEAQIRALGDGAYDGFIVLKIEHDGVDKITTVGMVTEFKPGPDAKASIGATHPNLLDKRLDHPDQRLKFPPMTFTGEITPGKMAGDISGPWMRPGESTFTMARIKTPKSATLGAEPPKGAIVLFDGRDRGQWKEPKWKIVDGTLQAGGGNITTKQSLTNFLLHLEFRTPFMPDKRGQERGNSGVYLRSVFEVQVLDSFGLFPLEDNDCGGIYKVQAPDVSVVNACLPPGDWQTYDITYREGDKRSMSPPEITVVQNGKTVVQRARVPLNLVVNGTGGGEVDGGYLMLQDHGNPVQYRNIWVQPIE